MAGEKVTGCLNTLKNKTTYFTFTLLPSKKKKTETTTIPK